MLYGLPLQTRVSKNTLRLDHFSVFGYAHVLSFKKHQRKIAEAALPDSIGRHLQSETIAEAPVDSGYKRIGSGSPRPARRQPRGKLEGIKASSGATVSRDRPPAIVAVTPAALPTMALEGLEWTCSEATMSHRRYHDFLGGEEDRDFPLIIANLPATAQQKAVSVGVAVLLLVAAATIAPFASIQLGRLDAFIPVLQTSLCLADLITAALLFAQYSIQPQRALLALASGYICSGSFAFLQTLAFPGGYAPNGLIGDGPNSPAWIYVLWHTTFSAAILIYALSKDTNGTRLPRRSTTAEILFTLAATFTTIAVLTWIVTTKTEYIPSFYTNDVRLQTLFGNRVNLALLLWSATALTVLLLRRRTILDLWLMVTLLAAMPNFLVAMMGSSVRFTVGWYAARCFVLISSCMLLTVLLIETMLLYSRLANAITLQRRERANRLFSVDAVAGAIAHELRSPLGAIALNADTALNQLRSTPPELGDLENILDDIYADSHRAAAAITSMREMTAMTTHRNALTSAEDAAQLALRLLKHDLQTSEISVSTEFQGNLPEVQLDGMALQQILLNLIRNAIEAMSSLPPESRRLRIKTTSDGQSTVSMSVQDSGPGISAEDRKRIFDPFYSTKHDGMGLGLAISSTLIERYGGKLRLVKSDVDGSIFELEMAVGRRDSARGTPSPAPDGHRASAAGVAAAGK